VNTTLPAAYPAPTVVVGLGRFGLAVLERLGEEWRWLAAAGDDPSLKNLRLLHARPTDDGEDPRWREGETLSIDVARWAGDGDLPTRSLSFAVLRALGLVRYYDGRYQVAVPQDAGLVELVGGPEDRHHHPARRRFFTWHDLSPDPLVSVERLWELSESTPELDLFVSPIVNRVRQGHSPATLLCCVLRCWRLAEGRDPSPWAWVREPLHAAVPTGGGRTLALRAVPPWVPDSEDGEGHATDHLRLVAPEPLPGWGEWWPAAAASDGPELHVPGAFVPADDDLASPLDPIQLLCVDWEASGWATHATRSPEVFTPAPASRFRLGLFDHDGQADVRAGFSDKLAERLQELAVEVHRGLVRLWVDLQRQATRRPGGEEEGGRRHHGVGDAVRQSLEVLGELLIRPLAEARRRSPPVARAQVRARSDPWVDGPRLDDTPSRFLRNLVLERRGAGSEAERALESRLDALGLGDEQVLRELRRPLLRRVELEPDDVAEDGDETTGPSGGVLEFRRLLNEEARHLLHFPFLAEYRQLPVRTPPRLSVFVVGDVTEPFVRAAVRTVLREVHAELQRAFGPIFDTYREGFDRSLSVVPILWMPHPADAFGGRHPVENRCEEAAIIDAVHGVRRWVETIPAGTRCISQVFVNSRVTDNATLGQLDAVRQTCDFLSFQVRNDLSREHWLRATASGPPGGDFFSSFSCHEVHFPAERAREYLANRLARACLRQLELGADDDGEDTEEKVRADKLVAEALEVVQGKGGRGTDADAAIEGALDEGVADLRDRTTRSARAVAEEARGRLALTPATTAVDVAEAFDPSFGDGLVRHVQDRWQELSEARGGMDASVDAVRRRASSLLEDARSQVRGLADRLVVEHASRGGLHLVQSGLSEVESAARARLQQRETARRERQAACLSHGIPDAARPIHAAREGVVEEGRAKPDLAPLRLGLLVWALLAPVLAAPLAWALARALRLDQDPGVAELLLGPLGPLTVGALLVLPAWWLLRRHMNRALERLREAVDDLARAAARVVDTESPEADGGGGGSCVRSFFETRLRLSGALATRAHALRVHEQVVADGRLAFRLRRSLDVQQQVLRRRAEELGAHPAMDTEDGAAPVDDVAGLFAGRWGDRGVGLVHPERLIEYYRQRFGQPGDVPRAAEAFADAVGGFSAWRKAACLADTVAQLDWCRPRFAGLVEEAVGRLPAFEQEVGRRLVEFVARHYPNVGFPAKFIGYEGLDPDEVHVLADAALVVDPVLGRAYSAARRIEGAPATTETMPVVESRVLPNSAYMLSLAQGIRAHSLRNLGRFESYLDRARVPEIIHFPTAGTLEGRTLPLNPLSGHAWLSERVSEALRRLGTWPGPGEPDEPEPADEAGDG